MIGPETKTGIAWLAAALLCIGCGGSDDNGNTGGDPGPSPSDGFEGDAWVAATGCTSLDGDTGPSGGDEAFPSECWTCHGTVGNTNPAPPRDRNDETATTFQGVGAHQSHLRIANWRARIRCKYCHVVPATKDDAGHQDAPAPDDAADLTFSGLALSDGASPNYVTHGGCSMVYCHGSTLNAGGATHSPNWTKVDGTQNTCRSCHDSGITPTEMPGRHAPHILEHGIKCDDCHPDTNPTDGSFLQPWLHLDGRPSFVCDNGVTFDGTRCTGRCHVKNADHYLEEWIP